MCQVLGLVQRQQGMSCEENDRNLPRAGMVVLPYRSCYTSSIMRLAGILDAVDR